MRNYHIVLTNGTERNLKATLLEVTASGVLEFSNGDELICVYAPGVWAAVEVERVDDKAA